ncbi:MAG: ATP-binding protein [Lautropia sp.]
MSNYHLIPDHASGPQRSRRPQPASLDVSGPAGAAARQGPGGRAAGRLTGLLRRLLAPRDAMLRHARQASIGLGLLNSLREPLAYVVLHAGTVRLTGGNPALERLVERSSAELAGLSLDRLAVGVEPDFDERIHDALTRQQHYCCRARVLDRFGAARPVVLRVEPVAGLSATDARALVYLDPLEAEIEQLRLIASQFASAQRSLREKSDRLSKLEQELNTLGSMMSHDLRAPLRTIDGFARILAEDHAGELDRFGREHLSRIQHGAARMNRMIDAFRDLTLVSAQSFSPIPIDLSALARDVAADATVLPGEPGTAAPPASTLRRERIEVEDGMHVEADPQMMRVLLTNLIANALKFSARVDRPLVRVGMRRDADGRRIVFVQDNGAGFDNRFAERLFGPFQRLHSASEYPGTGIGLAIARRIVRRHGGEIWADGAVGRGATFYFTLPG